MGGLWGRAVVGVGRVDSGPAGLYWEAKVATDETKEDPSANRDKVAKLLKELEDAQATGKKQTEQELRNKLNELREELGDEKFKEILEQLKKDAPESVLSLLKALFPDLFPDESTPSVAPPASPPTSPGGGGGGL
ncbi:hypothetical protein CQZ99_25490, partial [Pseudomonas poae]